MSALWTRDEALAATGGRARGSDWQAAGVSIDTRTLQPGDLFVALTAARDGHDFVADALAKGASAALVSRLPAGVGEDAPLLVVDDVQKGLEALGRAGRARSGARFIAITGSAGKTTTKEMARAVFSDQGRCHASVASYNNHWGVPLTLARLPRDAEFAVIEIGMNAPGEIAPLAAMARPHLAMVTTVAAAHLEAFGRIEGIAHEKASIYSGLEPGGIALANADVDTAPILFDAARAAEARLIRFGEAKKAEARLEQVEMTGDATIARARIGDERLLFKLSVAGRHFASNALAVLAAADALGLDLARAVMALGRWQPVEGRGRRERLVLNLTDDQGIELIDDAFNANPASIAASLEVLAATDPAPGGRRIAVLGDMLELGEAAEELHAEIAELPTMAAVAEVHTAGPLMEHLHEALPRAKRGLHRDTASGIVHALPDRLRPGDVVLVKGSKGSKVSLVVDALRKLGQAQPRKR